MKKYWNKKSIFVSAVLLITGLIGPSIATAATASCTATGSGTCTTGIIPANSRHFVYVQLSYNTPGKYRVYDVANNATVASGRYGGDGSQYKGFTINGLYGRYRLHLDNDFTVYTGRKATGLLGN